jgi:diketogulonate reductase-like aldo/keto reductase
MAGVTNKAAVQAAAIEEIELDDSEMKELCELAEETRKHGIKWEDLKAELGL